VTKQEIILANQQYLFPSVFHYFKEPLVVERAKDQYVWDADGNRYLDLRPEHYGIAVGAFADPDFPPPTLSVWEQTKHAWINLPEFVRL